MLEQEGVHAQAFEVVEAGVLEMVVEAVEVFEQSEEVTVGEVLQVVWEVALLVLEGEIW